MTEEVTHYRDMMHIVNVSEEDFYALKGYMGREYKHQSSLLDFYYDLRDGFRGQIIETKARPSDLALEDEPAYSEIILAEHIEEDHPTLF